MVAVLVVVAMLVAAVLTYVAMRREAVLGVELLQQQLAWAREHAIELERQLHELSAKRHFLSPPTTSPEPPTVTLPRIVRELIDGIDDPDGRADADEYARNALASDPTLDGNTLVNMLLS